MKTQDANLITERLDDATDGIESARKHLKIAIDRAERASDTKLAAVLRMDYNSLEAISNNIGSVAVPSAPTQEGA